MENLYPHLFEPLEIRGRVLKNRIFSAPNMLYQVVNGRPTDQYVDYLEHKARGGAAVVTLGEAAVCEGARHTPPMYLSPENLNIFGEMSMTIHQHGALAAVELSHGGRCARPWYNDAQIKGPNTEITEDNGFYVVAMTKQDMEDTANAYADAAAYWLSAGWDIAHVHAGHSWLIPQFLSPIINRRTDEFGGSLENRMRFPLMILQRMRERVGNRMLISLRISGSERVEGGFTPEDISIFLQRCEQWVDFAEISTERWEYCMPTTYMPRSTNVPLSAAIKATGRVKMPLFVIGSILDPGEAEEIIASGKADGVSLSRALIADPCFPKKARTGHADDITPCIRCMDCTMTDNKCRRFECSVNPTAAYEMRRGFSEDAGPAKNRRSVLVIGGGPAGMQAAITAARRGHTVTLVEKEAQLGGIIRYTDVDPLKPDLHRFKEYLVHQVEKSGIRVLLNTAADAALVDALAPEHIIVATGSIPKKPVFIPGWERAHCVTDVYFRPETVKGGNIVIIGGGLSGVEAALFLRAQGKNVAVVELLECMADVGGSYRGGIEVGMKQYGRPALYEHTRCAEITAEGVRCVKDDEEFFLPADSVFYAIGMQSERTLYYEIAGKAPFVDLVGDSREVATVRNAIRTGYDTAMDVGLF